MSVSVAATFSVIIKEAIANMPDILNTKKEIDEYYKKAMKDITDKIKEEKKALKKAEPKAPKEPKEPKKRVKKAKPAEVDEDGNEIVKVKKPLNKYQMFIQQQRPKVKEDYPELSGEEIFTKIAELWKQHKEGADNKSDEKEIKKINVEIKKIDSDDDADKASDANANDSGESESGNESDWNESEVDEADAPVAAPEVVEVVAVVATATPAPVVVADKKANASGGKAPRKALSTKPAKK